ncbi:MAG: hypothetical protein IT360_26345 [Gemmatimonadaceae bacterium]|nr:hypothetical protein [Gemmatimonadaceae bacterium]
MSSLRRALRLPLAVASILVLAFTTACSDTTGPDVGARSGYLTSSNTVNLGYNVPASTGGTTTKSGKATGTQPIAVGDSTHSGSGYNVPAF